MWRHQLLPALFLALLSCVEGALFNCSGGHFRYGSISHRLVSGYTVQFTIKTEWKRSFSTGSIFAGRGEDGRAVTGDQVSIPGVWRSSLGNAKTIMFETGDGTSSSLILTVTSYSFEEDYLYGYTIFQHTYDRPNDGGNDWLPTISGCCRCVGEEVQFKVTARVNLAYDTSSLIMSSLPVIELAHSIFMQNVLVASNTYEGDLAQSWQFGSGMSNLTYLVVNTSALGVGYHAVVAQIALERAVTPYDFMLKVVSPEYEADRPYFILGKPVMTIFNDNGVREAALPLLEGYLGYEILFTLTAFTSRSAAEIKSILSFSLPAGAELRNVVREGSPGNSTMNVDFAWTPVGTQANHHFVCFEAVDSLPLQLSSGQHCVQLLVLSVNPAPSFDSPPANSVFRFFMAKMNMFDINGINDNPYDNLLIFPARPLQFGQKGQEMSNTIASEKRVKATDPAAKQQPSSGPPTSHLERTRRCVRVIVERCKYLVQANDDMKTIGVTFRRDWLTIWSMNQGLMSFTPAEGSLVQIGRLYYVQAGDTMQSISMEFGMTMDDLRSLNYDLSNFLPADKIPTGLQICIFPDTCNE
ncbi:hypothetical protein GUITHDRAFT_101127 [Guillardia theta CCMP2712]|uniref:LysM domain-containing protein n=1 Tax=Guillardia theta (strain CCMP2712) TaxID=905079 RepID=L1JYZ0_GUITC|nr:hypothetical protein GUITHDRAFT_101127 [Guillardia theta CCMP2712]EKX53425.1 hypothetical protein GUITHDRAFT_101127 [Guillardia theta CCMP2712]|eukprot:XP_005840405.1 hypothetical protein GUITHDRAFT_101127 [Guillardia theta CCMP2712]